MPESRLLEAFETPAGVGDRSPIVIEHIAEEFTSQCPKTGQPDFGTVTIRYQPGAAGKRGCVELKSLKMYLQSFRMEGIFYEAVTHRIRDDLVGLMKPVWLQVVTSWRGRGGIRSVIRAEYGEVPGEYRGR